MCGYEFCRSCFRNSLVCPDCAEEAKNDSFGDGEKRDFEDVGNLDGLLNDAEIDALVDDEDVKEIPAEDLVDDEAAEEREEEVTPYEGEEPD